MSAWTLLARARTAGWIASSLLVLLGCRGAQHVGGLPPAKPETVAPRPLTPDERFETAVSSLSQQVQLLAAAHGNLDAASVRRAIGSMADAIANVPDAQNVDVQHAAAIIRTDYGNVVGATGPLASRRLREAVTAAANVLTLLANGPYACDPVARRVADLERAGAALNPNEAIEAQPQVVIHALARAAAALASLERASGIVKGVTEAQGGAPTVAPLPSAISKYSAGVDLLSETPPRQVPIALFGLLSVLPDALRAVPGTAAVASSDDLALVRSYASAFETAPFQSAVETAFTKGALGRADAILSRVASKSFGHLEVLSDELRALRQQVGAIDASRPLAAEFRLILGAFEAADDVMREMAHHPRP